MRYLFIHQNFPAQFGVWGNWLVSQGHDVIFATEREGVTNTNFPVVTYKPHRAPTPDVHHYIRSTEAAIIASQGFARVAIGLKNKGYKPDIVVAHSGWGGGTFVKDIWPGCLYVPYFEWYYNWPPVDGTIHDAPQGDVLDKAMRSRARNLPFMLDLAAADMVISPTQFQASQFPEWMRHKITVSHDGIDTRLHRPGPRNEALLAELDIPQDAQVVTWIARGMEPARGFPEMMAAMTKLMAERPDLHIIIVGDDRVAYGAKVEGLSWKKKMIEQHKPDLSRMHFTGLVSRNRLIEIIRLGHLHLYLTAPFVLSWSCLDAMACGALIVGSNTAPVKEFITDEENGLLVDMYDAEALPARIAYALDNQEKLAPLREAARHRITSTIDDATLSFPARTKMLEDAVEKLRTR